MFQKNISIIVGNFLPLGVAEFAGPYLLELVGSGEKTPTRIADHPVTWAAENSPSPSPTPWMSAIAATSSVLLQTPVNLVAWGAAYLKPSPGKGLTPVFLEDGPSVL